jgi:hypothetical protein
MARVLVGSQGNSTRSLSASFLAVPGVYARQRPRARHPSTCVRLGDLGGVAQINLVLKTVSYYPQTEE